MADPIKAYKDGYNDGVRIEPGQVQAMRQGPAPSPPKDDNDTIGHYKQGYYDGAVADEGQREAQRTNTIQEKLQSRLNARDKK